LRFPGAFAPDCPADPTEMAEEGPPDVTPVRATSAGRGLGWTDEESLALTRAAVAVSTTPTVGANMSSTLYARLLCVTSTRVPYIASCFV
jgi:hypothetical protein